MALHLHCFPAGYGDSLLLSHGSSGNERYVLVDGGTGGTRHSINDLFLALPEDKRKVELLVVTHVDRDHIEGILSLLEQKNISFSIGEIWFNGWQHLPKEPAIETFGALQEERLSRAILEHGIAWNKSFHGKAVMVPDEGELPFRDLPGGLRLTVLSPYEKQLIALWRGWNTEVMRAELESGYGIEEYEEAARAAAAEGIEAFGPKLPNVEELNKKVS